MKGFGKSFSRTRSDSNGSDGDKTDWFSTIFDRLESMNKMSIVSIGPWQLNSDNDSDNDSSNDSSNDNNRIKSERRNNASDNSQSDSGRAQLYPIIPMVSLCSTNNDNNHNNNHNNSHNNHINNNFDNNEATDNGQNISYDGCKRSFNTIDDCFYIYEPPKKRARKREALNGLSIQILSKKRNENEVCKDNENVENRQSKKMKSMCEKVLSIEECLLHIISYLHVFDAHKYLRVNSFWYQELKTQFWIDNNEIYFSYKSKMMKSMMERDLCDDIKHLVKYHLQRINFSQEKENGFVFTDIADIDIGSSIASNEKESKKSGSNCDRKVLKLFQVTRDEQFRDSSMECREMDIIACLAKVIKQFNESKSSEVIDIVKAGHTLLFGYLYNIKMIKNESMKLESSKKDILQAICFNHMSGVSRYCTVKEDCASFWYDFESSISWLEYEHYFVSLGYPLLFTISAIKNNFDFYHTFTKAATEEIEGKERSNIVLSGSCDKISHFAFMYLRCDILQGFMIADAEMDDVLQLLLLVLKPRLLLNHKARMMESKSMMVVTKEEEYNMDIFNNATLGPRARINFLRLLCLSTKFVKSLAYCVDIFTPDLKYYHRFRNEIHKLYYDFDYFACEWHLNEYKEYKDKIFKQKELHDDVKILIQLLFGLGYLYSDEMNIKFEFQCNESLKNLANFDNDNEMIDLKPKNEKDYKILYNVLIDGKNENEIVSHFEWPVLDRQYFAYESEYNQFASKIKFVMESNPCSLFLQLWEMKVKYVMK